MSLLNNRYEKIAKIGEGSFGRVFLACDRKNSLMKSNPSTSENEEKKENGDSSKQISEDSLVALKKLKCTEKFKEKFNEINEIKFLLKISHENIIKLQEAFFDKDSVYMVLDYMSYDLERLLSKFYKSLTIEDIKIIMFQIFKGVAFLHENRLIHRDLKSSNMLINGLGMVKISDFSLVRELPEKIGLMTKNVVTRFYRPPEIIFGSQSYDASVDIWSLGCVLAECFLGKFLFEGGTDIAQLSQIFQVLGPPTEENWPGCTSLPFFIGFQIDRPETLKKKIPNISVEAFDLLSKMLVLDPLKRISIKEVLAHPFLSNVQDFKKSNFALLMNTIEKEENIKHMAKKK